MANLQTPRQRLHDKLTLRSTVEFGYFLCDVVESLSSLSLALQTRDLSVGEVADHADATITVLQLVTYGEK